MPLNCNNTYLAFTAGNPAQLPGKLGDGLPQVAFCGRSNVGKSSLINRLLHRKSLARVSAEPGKTITINCYEVDGTLMLVDLPGYGYAKRSMAEREKWKRLIDRYFETPGNRLYLQLVDAKVGITKDDEAMLTYLTSFGLPFAVVMTKIDKLNRTGRDKNFAAIRSHAAIPEDAAVVPFSAKTGEGREAVWKILDEFLQAVADDGDFVDKQER